MKKILLAITALVIIVPIKISAQTPVPAQYENSIYVTGNAEREIVPDEIFLNIMISENDTKGKVSIERMEINMISKLQEIGIDTDENLKIGDMSSKFHNQLFKTSTRTTASYQLKVDSALTLGRVYQALESIGISNITISKLSHSKIREYENELRQEAIIDAKKNAQSLAGAIGQTAGRAVYITDNRSPYVNTDYAVAVTGSVRSSGTSSLYDTELSFRNIKISHSVTAKFVLE